MGEQRALGAANCGSSCVSCLGTHKPVSVRAVGCGQASGYRSALDVVVSSIFWRLPPAAAAARREAQIYPHGGLTDSCLAWHRAQPSPELTSAVLVVAAMLVLTTVPLQFLDSLTRDQHCSGLGTAVPSPDDARSSAGGRLGRRSPVSRPRTRPPTR